MVYKIVDLEIGSAVISLEAEAEAGSEVDAADVVGRFAEGVMAYRDGTLPMSRFDRETQQAFGQMLAPLRRSLRSFAMVVDEVEVVLASHELRPLQLRPESETAAVGSFSGFVDALNVHSDSVFYLYPTQGPTKISCTFDRGILEEVRSAIKRYTTVFGLLEYTEGSPFPSRIVVSRLEVNPPSNELPTLRSLVGIAPNLTRGVDAVTFVRRQRDAEA